MFTDYHNDHLKEIEKLNEEIENAYFEPLMEDAFSYFKNEEKFDKIKFNVESLDNLTGGIDLGCVTEIYGEAGSGKTQLCLQLALNCQLPRVLGGLDGKAIYVSTEKLAPVKRIDQMQKALKQKAPEINFMDNILVYEFNTPAAFELFIRGPLRTLLVTQNEPIKILIIDSITSLYKLESNYIKRSKHMRSTFEKLVYLATKFNFAILCTNHISAVPTDPDRFENLSKPSLGMSWASILTTRMQVSKTEKSIELSADGNNFFHARIRKLKVMFSPRLPVNCAHFLVSPNGIESITSKQIQPRT